MAYIAHSLHELSYDCYHTLTNILVKLLYTTVCVYLVLHPENSLLTQR
jgi:hypothetical protein